MAEKLLTVHELADALSVPTSWVYQRTRQRGPDTMPLLRCGKYPRFNLSEVIAWLKKQQAQEAA